MKLVAQSMPALRAAAVGRLNQRFNGMALQNSQRDAAHAEKRAVAATVIAGGAPSDEFTAEAGLRDLSVLALAQLIAGKPNEAAQRELERQRQLLLIAAAAIPSDLPD